MTEGHLTGFCRANMDSYEDFCTHILSKLQSDVMHQKSCSTVPAQRGAHSFIRFHDRAVLSPLLYEKQIQEMVEYKNRAIQLEAKRQIQYKNNLYNQIQNIVWTSKAPKIVDDPDPVLEQHTSSIETEHSNGCTVYNAAKLTPGGGTESFILTSKPPVTPSTESSGAIKAKVEEEKQIQEQVKTEVSLQHLLKRSREFIEKEQGRQGSKFINSTTGDSKVMPSESPSDIENDSFLDGTGSFLPCVYPPSPTSHGPLITPEPNVILRPHRGRPRPISAGSIFFTYSDNPNQANITTNGRPQGALTPGRERRLLGVENVSLNQSDGLSRFSPLTETTKARLETSLLDPELTCPLFRRRCHTLDSQPSSCPLIDRSQERMPRFMAGVTPKTPHRVSPTSPMNKTFTRESPISAFMGSGLTPGSPSHGSLSFEIEGLCSSFIGQDALSCVTGEDGCELRVAGEHYSVLSPVCSLSPGDGSPRHLVSGIDFSGFPSTSLDIPSPSIQTPIYIWGLNHSAGKNRIRLSQVITGEQQRTLCRLCAIVKGFLIRRLLKTEKVKHLRQTVQDTQEFIGSFGGSRMSEQDVSLHERVRAQLRAARFDIHDIFFTLTLEERLSLLQQDRDLRTERKLREMEKAKAHKDKMILSAATQKSLDRKKQRVGESPVQTRKSQKTKSPPTKRILQPSQGQNALVSGQKLLRCGSYKKSPEERVQHSERLKKQHSLG